MSLKIKSKDVKVIDGKVVITQQTEQTLNREELIQNKILIQRRKQQLVVQSRNLKAQYDEACSQEGEIDSMILSLQGSGDEIITIEGENNGSE